MQEQHFEYIRDELKDIKSIQKDHDKKLDDLLVCSTANQTRITSFKHTMGWMWKFILIILSGLIGIGIKSFKP